MGRSLVFVFACELLSFSSFRSIMVAGGLRPHQLLGFTRDLYSSLQHFLRIGFLHSRDNWAGVVGGYKIPWDCVCVQIPCARYIGFYRKSGLAGFGQRHTWAARCKLVGFWGWMVFCYVLSSCQPDQD